MHFGSWPRGEFVATLKLFFSFTLRSETVHNCAKLLADLEKMVRRMVLESLGVLKYYEAQNESTWYLLRLAEYGAPHTEEKRMGYYSHQDTNTLTIICQDQVGGLEVQTKDGQWIPVEPSRTSFVVMAGNALRVYALLHARSIARSNVAFVTAVWVNLIMQFLALESLILR